MLDEGARHAAKMKVRRRRSLRRVVKMAPP